QCIPLVLEGKDVLGTAQTGTGKTGAFVIPLLNKIIKAKESGAPQATRVLILTPTRELASQIDEQIFALGYYTGVSSAIVIGGSDFSVQAKSMKNGVDVVVATPGRLLDQMNVLQLNFDQLDFLVLDEADRMLDMGFLPDVKNILRKLPPVRQNLMFSATFPPQIQRLTEEMMKDPVRVNIATSKTADTIRQEVYQIY
ncbi:DEAD/DEAH box helicase, partial [Arthrospira platensis SPKY1]|nr:DEAD/DEAH box helicase [Arthrospira platensis SPKY1]